MEGFPTLLEKILTRPLTLGEARSLALEMLEGRLDDIAVAALLVALRARGEDAEEVAGFALALRERAQRPRLGGPLLDTAGTGGDGRGTLNASTAAALVASALGARVAKHGNRSVSSRSGSADFLEALGYPIDLDARGVECVFIATGFAFLLAPVFHPLMARVMPVRRRLGIRTLFNLAGPLANPAQPSHQVLGVASPQLMETMASAGSLLGYERLLVVHGHPGIDEVSVTGETLVLEGGELAKLKPRELGVGSHPLHELAVGGPLESARRFERVAGGGGREADRDFIAANAGVALYASGQASDPREGVEMALQALGEGRVAMHLKRIVEVARSCRGRG